MTTGKQYVTTACLGDRMKLLNRSRSSAPTITLPEEPSVRLVPYVPPQPGEPGEVYLVRDGRGEIHQTQSTTRKEALREMGGIAVRGAAAPLFLLTPGGEPTGDRLA